MESSVREIIESYDRGAPLAGALTIPAPWYVDPRVAELERRASDVIRRTGLRSSNQNGVGVGLVPARTYASENTGNLKGRPYTMRQCRAIKLRTFAKRS